MANKSKSDIISGKNYAISGSKSQYGICTNPDAIPISIISGIKILICFRKRRNLNKFHPLIL